MRGALGLAIAVLFSAAILSPPAASPGPSPDVGAGEAVMGTDKPCYKVGEPVHITATGSAAVPAIGDFPTIFWGVSNESSEAVWQTFNMLTAVGSFSGTMEGSWNQSYRLYNDARTGTPVPPGLYTIWFYAVLPPDSIPPGWIPAHIEIGPCTRTPSATLHVEPRTLNLRSMGRWVTAQVVFDQAVSGEADAGSLSLAGIPARQVRMLSGTTILMKFDRAALIGRIAVGSSVVVCLDGVLSDGQPFRACDTLRVIDPAR